MHQDTIVIVGTEHGHSNIEEKENVDESVHYLEELISLFHEGNLIGQDDNDVNEHHQIDCDPNVEKSTLGIDNVPQVIFGKLSLFPNSGQKLEFLGLVLLRVVADEGNVIAKHLVLVEHFLHFEEKLEHVLEDYPLPRVALSRQYCHLFLLELLLQVEIEELILDSVFALRGAIELLELHHLLLLVLFRNALFLVVCRIIGIYHRNRVSLVHLFRHYFPSLQSKN